MWHGLFMRMNKGASCAVLSGLVVCGAAHSQAAAPGAGDQKGMRSAELTAADSPHIMTIDDTARFENGPMRSSVSVSMVAVTKRGDRGPYSATASSATTNEMTSGGASINAPSKTPIPPFAFSLQPRSSGPDGTLEASGMMSITSTGTGTVTAGGMSRSTQLRNQATVPYTITVNGSNVLLKVDAGGQQLTFKGTLARMTFSELQARDPKAADELMQDKAHDMQKGETGR